MHRKKKTESYPKDTELSRIKNILSVVKKFEKEDFQKIYKNYLKLFTIPYKGLNYHIVPESYQVEDFERAVKKFEIETDIKETTKVSISNTKKNRVVDGMLIPTVQNNKDKLADDKNLPVPKFEPVPTSVERELIQFSSFEIPEHRELVSDKVYSLSTGNINPNKRSRNIIITDRKQNIVSQLKALYENTCQICKEKLDIGNDEYYSEVHHIQPLGKHNGPDIPENMIVLCPNHHKMFDKGAITIDLNLQKVIHINEKQKISGKSIILKHEINIKYINYHDLNMFKIKPNQSQKKNVVDYEDTVLFFDGTERIEVTLESYFNRHLMNNMQRILLHKSKGEKVLFNDYYYQVIDIVKNK